MQLGIDADAYVTRLLQWITENKALSTADNAPVNSLNKKATQMRNNTTEDIETALDEVSAIIEKCDGMTI